LSNRNLRQGGGYSSVSGGINVPSPAPLNNCSNILAGNFIVENGNVNKNGGGCCSNNNIVHSTPIGLQKNFLLLTPPRGFEPTTFKFLYLCNHLPT